MLNLCCVRSHIVALKDYTLEKTSVEWGTCDILMPCYLIFVTYRTWLIECGSCIKVWCFRHITEVKHVVMQRWGRIMIPQNWCVELVVMCQEPRCVLNMAQIS
jgi:hypothetical protein